MVAEVLDAQSVGAGIARLDGWSGDPTGIRRTAELPSFIAAIDVLDAPDHA